MRASFFEFNISIKSCFLSWRVLARLKSRLTQRKEILKLVVFLFFSIISVLVKETLVPVSRSSVAPWGLARSFRARRSASSYPPLSRDIKTRSFFLRVYINLSFLFVSTIFLVSAAVCALLRLSTIVYYRLLCQDFA